MIYLYDRDGKPVAVSEYEAPEALRSGQLFLQKGVVNFVDRETGELFGVDSSQAVSALEAGHRMESHEQAQERRASEQLGPLAPVAAAAAGALRGASLGLSDFVLTESGLVDPKDLRQLEEGFQASSIAGELGGAVGGVLLQKKLATPAGMAGRLGTATSKAIMSGLAKEGVQYGLARRALTKLAASAGGGAVEGALFGAGGALSEYALGKTDELGEALVAHVGPAALLGGSVGAGFGLVGELAGTAARKAANKLKGLGISEKLSKGAFREAVGAASGMGPQAVRNMLKRRPSEWVGRLKRLMFEGIESPGGEVVGPIAKIGASAEELAANSKAVAEKFGQVIGNARGQADDLGAAVATSGEGSIAVRIKNRIEDLFPHPKAIANKADKKLRRRLTEDLPRELEAEGSLSVDFLSNMKSSWQSEARTLSRGARTQGAKMAREASKIMQEELDDVLKKTLPDDVYKEYAFANDTFSLIADIADESAAATWAAEAQTFFDRASKMAARSAMWRMAAGGFGGAAMGGIPGAVVGAGVMAGAGALAKRALGPAGGAVLRHRAANMLTLQNAEKVMNNRITKAVKSFMKGTRRAVVPSSATILNRFTGTKDRQKAFKQARDTISKWQSDPAHVTTMLTTNLASLQPAAPESSTHATMAVGRAKDYIASNLPPTKSTLQPLLDQITPADIRKFAEHLSGSMDPLGVIDDFGNLQMSYTQVQAFRMAYPATYARMTDKVIEAITRHEKPLTDTQHFFASMFLGYATHPSLTGQAIANVQSSFAPQGSPQAPAAKGTEFENLGQAQMGAAQRMEMPV